MQHRAAIFFNDGQPPFYFRASGDPQVLLRKFTIPVKSSPGGMIVVKGKNSILLYRPEAVTRIEFA